MTAPVPLSPEHPSVVRARAALAAADAMDVGAVPRPELAAEFGRLQECLRSLLPLTPAESVPSLAADLRLGYAESPQAWLARTEASRGAA